MDRLRPRQRLVFSGFSKAEIEKMEKLLKSERPFNKEFFQKVARSFNSSSGRAGKPIVKWTEVQSWFQQRQHDLPYKESSVRGSEDDSLLPKSIPLNEVQGKLSQLEFEARSSKDGAWYDVDLFLSHRVVTPGESEVRVRFVGFGPEEDEWVNIRNDVRERSIPLEPSECQNVKVGDLVCCFQERRDQAIYYDAHVMDIQRKTHDIRGCRCIFLVQYDHDGTEERIRLRRICRRPN